MDRTDVNPRSDASLFDYRSIPVLRPEHREGSLTRLIEQQTAKIPSDLFLLVALSAMAISLVSELRGERRVARFVGMWPGPLLVMGVYNKLVKVLGPR
jgi:hypothetical protein